MRIGLDVDGVLADFTGGARKILKSLFDKPSDDMVQTSWDFDSLGITPEENARLWSVIRATPNWWGTLNRLEGSYSLGAAYLKHELFFVTSRMDTGGVSATKQTANWLHNVHGIEYPTVIVSFDKGPIIRDLALDYFIDDRDVNLYNCRKHHPDCKVYLKDMSYNQHVQDISRVKDVNDFLRRIGAI